MSLDAPRDAPGSLVVRPISRARRLARSVVLDVVGWTLLVAGLIALFVPGPGTLMVFAGVAVLAQRYAWAATRVHDLRRRALTGAAESVERWLRIAMSSTLALGLLGFGALWILGPPPPSWWGLPGQWWLPGGAVTGWMQAGSGLLGLGLLGWSFRRFRGAGVRAAVGESGRGTMGDIPEHPLQLG